MVIMNGLVINKRCSKLKDWSFKMPKISYCNRWRVLKRTKQMIIEFKIWKKTMRDWAGKIDASFNIVKTPSMGDNSDYFTIEIKKTIDTFGLININQSSFGQYPKNCVNSFFIDSLYRQK